MHLPRVPTIAVLLGAAGLLAHSFVGCGRPSEDDCSCFPSTLAISAPSGQVQSITASGACAGAKIICVNGPSHAAEGAFVPGCETYAVMPTGAGECAVHITTTSLGALDETRQVEDDTAQSCCGGYYVTPASSSKIALPGG